MNPKSAAFWSGVDAREATRAKRISRDRRIELFDDRAHVDRYELVAGLAAIVGWERAAELVSPNEGGDT